MEAAEPLGEEEAGRIGDSSLGHLGSRVDRVAKAGDNSLSAQTWVGAPITEEGE
jgi:hypothetical protein